MTVRHLRVLIAIAAFAPLLAAPVTALGVVKSQTGTYLAKAGSASFRFKVIAYTPTDRCGSRAGAYCFIDLTSPKIKAPCMNGQAEDNAFPVPNGFINSDGRFSYHQTSPLISFGANLKGDQVSGTLREKDVFDDGNGNVSCDTGVVHWQARRQ